MTSEQIVEVEKIYNSIMEKPLSIYNVFIDYFGEDRVDIKYPSLDDIIEDLSDDDISYDKIISHFQRIIDIIVWFPEVTIQNEYYYSTTAKDIWIKVPITIAKINSYAPWGCSNIDCYMFNSFVMTRSHYQMSHLMADYMHSHCPGIPWKKNHEIWKHCCLGTGPIKRTVATLCNEYNTDIWELFCIELDKYVHTESISGGPYRRISSISNKGKVKRLERSQNSLSFATFLYLNCCLFDKTKCINMLKDFIFYYIKNKNIDVCYTFPSWLIKDSFVKFRIDISKSFIDWFNNSENPWNRNFTKDNLLTWGFFGGPYLIDNNIIYELVSNRAVLYTDIQEINNMPMFIFKGKNINVEIEDDCDKENNKEVLLLSSTVTSFIVTTISQFINMKYNG